MLVRIRKPWDLVAERDASDEQLILSRRKFLGGLSLGVAGAALAGCSKPFASYARNPSGRTVASTIPKAGPPYPFPRNTHFALDRAVTDEIVAATYNNFYEFSAVKDDVWKLTEKFKTEGWQIEVNGLVAKPMTLTVEELVRSMPMEERLYRHRCVEAWAMAVPWTGFPLSKLLERVEPLSAARYVRFISFNRPHEAPGIKEQYWYTWPYYEALRMDEAMNPLTMVVTGIYGHDLPKQHGAPIRIVVPWKYGYKSPKSIVKIELVDSQPRTFWSWEYPGEYTFESNVDPEVPHPRWSQATERMIGTLETRKTLPFNGYGALVQAMYT